VFTNSLDIVSVSVSVLTTLLCVLLSYTLRGALFGATVFGSSELGLWKDGETSREVAKIIIAILTPYAKKAESQLPDEVSYCCQIKF
jgi:hypothetical protein